MENGELKKGVPEKSSDFLGNKENGKVSRFRVPGSRFQVKEINEL
jgi:hypothetical protein